MYVFAAAVGADGGRLTPRSRTVNTFRDSLGAEHQTKRAKRTKRKDNST